jgi:eukaryotic-like serine/threonine-protein kinase
MRDAPGARIGDYWIEGELPARRTEVAYRATHRMLPRCARVAVLKSEALGDHEAEVVLLREACILELLHHAGVPRVYECGALERRPWVATEHIDGTSVEQDAAEPLAIADALGVLRDAAAVLAHAHHRGVVHRNLTPASVIRTPQRDFGVCVVGWGMASTADHAGPPIREPGAQYYSAPELLDTGGGGGGSGGSAADVFALGAIIFEAATLVLPEPMQKFPGVPEPFHLLLASMLEREPEERPSAAAVHVEATRLVELFADGGAAIEEVEVELVDIANASLAVSGLGWMPPDQLSGMKTQPEGSARRRRGP